MEMDLDIVIVNWNTKNLLEQCLASILQCSTDLRYQVWVVDNASSDGSVAMLRELFPKVNLILNDRNEGFAKANNIVLRQVQSRYALLLNSDTYVKDHALDEFVKFMDAHPRVGAAGARILNPDGSLQFTAHPNPTLGREFWRLFHWDALIPLSSYRMAEWDLETPREVEVVLGACMIIRREVLEDVGFLDERFFFYSEEVDYCYRLRKKGYPIFWIPRAEVVHYGGQSSKKMPDKMFLQLYQGKILFFRKYQGWLGVSIYKLILLMATLFRLMLVPFAWLERQPKRAQHLSLAGNYQRLLFELAKL